VDTVPEPGKGNLRRLWDALVELEARPESTSSENLAGRDQDLMDIRALCEVHEDIEPKWRRRPLR
jgi:hypothetical protein